jgi:hypothetical protein
VHAATTEDKAATGEPAMKIILGQPKVGNRMLKLKSIEDEQTTHHYYIFQHLQGVPYVLRHLENKS